MSLSSRDRLMFPLDVPSLDEAARWVDLLGSDVGVFKVGLELFTRGGPATVNRVTQAQHKCFLDLKLHDIEETVARSVDAAIDLGVDFLTVHAANGPRTLERIAKRAEGTRTKLLAVTVLTNFDDAALSAIGVNKSCEAQVLALGSMATRAGVPGLVASPLECRALRATLGQDVTLVVPGIRPANADAQDQKRVATPATALADGATYLVIGRPIRDAADPRAAARNIVKEIDELEMQS